MAPFRGIATALDTKFPKPRVDSEWLEQCCSWVAEEKELSVTGNFEEFFEIVLQQLLNSDLKDSMQHGTGLPEVSRFTGNLSGPPVLVQIMAIKDMGISAFQLEQIRAAREERILAGVGDEEGEEDGDVEVEGEGPMPKYPRGTLLLRLSDGATEFEAMEYRPIPQLVLGVTELGFKLQLNGTRFSNGMAFLEPATIRLIGGLNAELNDEWEENFKQYLQARLMGQAAETQGTTPHPDLPRLSRAPLRDISPPPATLHDDDVDMEPRRKKPISISHEQNIATSSNPRSIKSLPNRLRKSGEMRENDIKVETKLEDSPPPQWEIFPKRSLPYRDTSVISVGNSVPHKSSGRGEQTSFDFDLLDEVDGNENVRPKPSRLKGKGRAIYDSPQKRHPPGGYSSDYGIDEENMFEDENFWEVLDRVEKKALDGERPKTQSKSNIDNSDGHSQRLSTGPATPPLASGNDVIELDDSDEDANKENAFVPMRHVRRKTEELVRGRSPTAAHRQKPTLNRKKKKATVSTPSEIIDISDSD